MPTMAIEFIGDNGYGYGTYHSNYDSRAYVERIADPGFDTGRADDAGARARWRCAWARRRSCPFASRDYATKLDDAITLADGWAKEAAMPIDVTALRGKAAAVREGAMALEAAVDA